MSESQPIPPELLAELLELAEGRLEPEGWLQWWSEHAAAVETGLKRAWFLRLKPSAGGGHSATFTAACCQSGACYVLDQLRVPYVRSERYQKAFEEEQQAAAAALAARKADRLKQYHPILKALEAAFPRFGRFLTRRIDLVEALSPGASEAEIAALEASLGHPLPQAYRRWLQCARTLTLGDALRFESQHPFLHPSRKPALPAEGMLCFAEFWLEADGDQVVFDLREGPLEDPPVFYYAHEASRPHVRKIAPGFTGWVEALPRCPAFRE